MSGLKDLIFGESPTPARIEDLRTPEQIAQQQGTLDFLSQLLQQGGLPTFSGPTTAPTSGLEADLLSQLSQFTQGGFPSLDAARSTLTNLAGGGTQNPIIANLSDTDSQLALQQQFDILTGRSADPNDPRLRAAIDAASRPILERFQDQTDINRNLFTRAGQFVQPGSSSPFELASSRLSTGLANALGDVGSNLVFANLTAERGRQQDLVGLLSGTEEARQNRSLTAAAQTVPFEVGQVEGITKALDTAALPRLIEQFGITQGQKSFDQQQTQLLEILRLLIGGNQPQIASIPGSPGGGGLLSPLLSAGATAFGGPIGGALATAILG